MNAAPTHHIPSEWLRKLAGTSLFYPCAGQDIEEPIRVFAPVVSALWFADIAYPRRLLMEPALPHASPHVVVDGDAAAVMENRDGRRFLAPSRRIETYARADGSSFKVIRRRGFAEIALSEEFPDGSIGVFLHRGDGGGEGGSAVSFFRDRPRRHAPLANLFSLLKRKLATPALVVTDGSNLSPRGRLPIARFTRTATTGEEAFAQWRGAEVVAGGLRWRCVGFLGPRYGPTLVWAVEPT